jgi:site-specific recombinase XerD
MEVTEIYDGRYSEDESIKNMILRMKRMRSSRGSMDGYVVAVQSFMDYVKADSPSEALLKVEGERDVVELLNGFLDYMFKNGLASNTIHKNFYGVKKWLITNRVKTDWGQVDLGRVEVEDQLRSPTLEELRVIFQNARLREKVLIALCVSSGVRIGSSRYNKNLLALTFGDIQGLEEEIPMIKVPPHKAKGRRGYFTFMTPEAKKLLLEYKEARENMGETITQDSPLITSIRKGEQGNHVDHHSIWDSWKKTLKRSGLDGKAMRILDDGEEVEGKRIVLSPHSLRRYFKTTCIMNGVPDSLVERWMGHKGKYLDLSYFHPSVKKMIEKYRAVVPHLTISETEELKRTLDTRITEEVGKVREDLKRKDEEIERLKEDVKRKEEEREKRLREMEEIIKNLSVALSNNNH